MKLIANKKYISSINGYKYDSMKYRFDTEFYRLYFGGLVGDKDSIKRYADSFNAIITADDTEHIETDVCPITDDEFKGMALVLSATPKELFDKNIHNKFLLANIRDAKQETDVHLLFRLDKLRYNDVLKRFENEPDEDVFIPLICDGEDFSNTFAGTKLVAFNIK